MYPPLPASHVSRRNITGKYLTYISYTPTIIQPWFSLAYAIGSQPLITEREKELAILAVLAEYDTPYVHYAHSQSARAAGFSQEQIDQALSGSELPIGVSAVEQAVYMAALAMAQTRGPLPAEAFEKAVAVLGREKVASVAHVVGGYMYVCLLSNVAHEKVPEVKPTEDRQAEGKELPVDQDPAL